MPEDVMDGQQPQAGNVPAGYVVDQASLTANPNGEGTYGMVGPDGKTVQIPFSKVCGAERLRYQVDPDDLKRYTKDAAAAQPGLTDRLAAWGEKSHPHITAADAQRQIKNLSPSGEHLPHSTEDGPSFPVPYFDEIAAPIDEFGENVTNSLVRLATSIPAGVVHGVNHFLSSRQWEIWNSDSWTPAGSQLKQQKEVEAALASGQGRVLAPGEMPPKPTAENWNDYLSEHTTGLIKMWAASKLLEPVLGVASKDLGFEQAASDGLREGARDVMGESETPAPSSGTAFSAPFSQITDSLDKSELSARAPKAERAAVLTIFQDHPNLRLQIADGKIEEMPSDEFFTLDPKTRDELKDRVINPITDKTLGQEQGLEGAQQGSDGGGLAELPDAPAEGASETAAPDGQTATEGSPQQDAGTGAAMANPSATNIPATTTPATTAPATSTPASTSAQAPTPQPSSTQPVNTPATGTPALGNTSVPGTPASTAGGAKPIPIGPVSLNVDKQIPHSPLNSLKQGRGPKATGSLLTADPYEMLKYAGTGQQIGPTPRGLSGFKERVNVGRVIGSHYDDKTGIGRHPLKLSSCTTETIQFISTRPNRDRGRD